ncbi:hypothetical protein BC831DRAFT_417795 [Entophlyctis helioformis]|nr:hypothetical protein BC831DRAFT_417795 [Entophlyctis helioformis]
MSKLGQQLLAQNQPPSEIEVVEVDDFVPVDQKETLHSGSVVVVKKSLKDGEECFNVHVIEGKKVGTLIGRLDKKAVIGNDHVVGKAYIVTNDMRTSDKSVDKRKSTKNKGMVKATLIEEIVEKMK